MVTEIVGGPVTTFEFRMYSVPDTNYLSKDIDENGKPTPRGD